MLYPAVLGIQEWWPILIVVLLLFGAKKLPELARSMGSSVNEFKKGMSDGAKPEEPDSDRPTGSKSNSNNHKEH